MTDRVQTSPLTRAGVVLAFVTLVGWCLYFRAYFAA